LAGKKANSKEVQKAKHELLADPQVKQLIKECLAWPQPEIKRHNDASHPIHQIGMLLDFGLDASDPPMQQIAQKILKHQNKDGAFLSTLNVSTNFGGTGKPELGWMLCDTPLLIALLIRLGYAKDKRVKQSVEHLASLVRDNGWPCAGSIPKFRGPGRKDDYCPYANLIALQIFALLPEYHASALVTKGLEAFWYHWDHQKEKKMYLFGIGTDFRKIKYPFVWFDIVHVVDILSHFPQVRKDKRFKTMWQLILDKADPQGLYTPESAYQAYKGWDFGQKKEPSPTLTLLVELIKQRLAP
jgi:hypothetical protein